ncbi:adhesion G protein-coupled receptor L3-like isoform X3 [Tubulanus polymorphus]|uniref:adhesion G protein-coupled receptor L3-like isoform X3 n=1 Tax=Tubulanus polymorphus TaxID=672921 RepID=UPI003DA4E6C3
MKGIILLVSCLLISLVTGGKLRNFINRGRFKRGESTEVYVCERDVLTLDCRKDSGIIHIERAVYGRFTLAICNPRGITEGWSTMCMSHSSLNVVHSRCAGKPTCTFKVNNDIFRDPCSDTYKYLEVHYQCRSAEIPTTVALTTESTTVATTKSTQTTTTTESRTTTAKTTPVNPKPVAQYCREVTARGITWPMTRAGHTAAHDCPVGFTGEAHHTCKEHPVKWSENPDLSKCTSQWVKEINSMIENGEPVANIAKELGNKTNRMDMSGGDLAATSRVLKDMVNVLKEQSSYKLESRSNRLKVAEEITESIVKVSDNLLSDKQAQSWKDIQLEEEKRMVATNVIQGIETSAIEVANTADKPTVILAREQNIIVEVKVVSTTVAVKQVVFPESSAMRSNPSTSSDPKLLNDDTIIIPGSVLKQTSVQGLAKVVFAIYDNLGQYMNPADSNANGDNKTNTIVNSKIISATLSDSVGKKTDLTEPVLFRLKHDITDGVEFPRCAFWNFKDSPNNGHWSTEGCRMVRHTPSETVCECDHLTNFAVLMDIVGTKLGTHHELSLTVITYAGCIISIVCLLLCWITFQFFRNLQCDRNTIHKNLVGTLLMAEIIFLAGIIQYDKKILCAIVAGLLHFLFLAAFAWMCLEGVQLYVMLIEVFEAEKSRKKWYYLSGYGLPLIVVAISAGVNPAGYGTDRHCWLSTENYFILAFVGPAAAVITVNVVMLSIAIYMMCRHANMAAKLKAKDRSRIQNARSSKRISFNSSTVTSSASAEAIDSRRKRSESAASTDQKPNGAADAGSHRRSLASTKSEDVPLKRHLQQTVAWIKGASVLVVLLGLTWAFGLLFLGEETVALAYIFTILNSLQGVFIFTFHCVMNDKVQKEYKKLVRRTSWLPDCVRIGYGGHTGLSNSGTPSRTSSNAANFRGNSYFVRLWSSRSRIRKKSSSTSLPAKSSAATGIVLKNNHALDISNNSNYSTLQRKQNNADTYDPGNLSKIDGSVVDSDAVSDYCRNNMLVNQDTGAKYCYRPKIPLNVKNEFSSDYVGEFTESEFSDADLFKMTDYCDNRLLKDRDREHEQQNMLREEEQPQYENGSDDDDHDDDDDEDGPDYEKVSDGYEEPIMIKTKSAPIADKNFINSRKNEETAAPLNPNTLKHSPSWNALHSDDPNHYDVIDPMRNNRQSTPNLKFTPPRQPSVTQDSLAFGRPDTYLRSMPNLAFNNDCYEQDSTVPSDKRSLLQESFRLKRTGSDPHGIYVQSRTKADSSEC